VTVAAYSGKHEFRGGNMINTSFSILFNVLGTVLIILIIYVVYSDPSKFGGPSVALASAALCLFVANIDRIESFKASFSSFEAKTREVQTVVDDARATVASLRKLAVATASFQADMLAAAGRFGGGGTSKQKEEQKAHLLEELRGIGLTDKELAEVSDADRRWVMFDYAFGLLRSLNVQHDPVKLAAYQKAFESGEPPTPDECADVLSTFHISDEKTTELLKDYRYYYETGKHRRPDVWLDRGNW
jgi:hypothetical protein